MHKGELENGSAVSWPDSVKEEATYNSAHKRLQDAVHKLERLKQEVNYLKTAVEDARRSLTDKDEIIALMKEKLAAQTRQTSALEAEIERLRS